MLLLYVMSNDLALESPVLPNIPCYSRNKNILCPQVICFHVAVEIAGQAREGRGAVGQTRKTRRRETDGPPSVEGRDAGLRSDAARGKCKHATRKIFISFVSLVLLRKWCRRIAEIVVIKMNPNTPGIGQI